ncbi:MAG: histidine phosphatase family protein [Spirochaetota bacterium]|nr:histidine phosphatase family protein [Spirochaetota bacterium]
MSTSIILIRHGETKWNRDKIFRGLYDIPLNDNGRHQARLTAEAMRSYAIDAAYTSPLTRAVETAEIVLRPHEIDALSHNGLLDMDYGKWTGKEADEVAQEWSEEYATWNLQSHIARPPGGTTIQEVFHRAFDAMEEICNQHNGMRVALFSHRVITKLLIIGALGLSLERFPFIIQGNCCINEIEYTSNGFTIRAINNTSHLRKEGVDLLHDDF